MYNLMFYFIFVIIFNPRYWKFCLVMSFFFFFFLSCQTKFGSILCTVSIAVVGEVDFDNSCGLGCFLSSRIY